MVYEDLPMCRHVVSISLEQYYLRFSDSLFPRESSSKRSSQMEMIHLHPIHQANEEHHGMQIVMFHEPVSLFLVLGTL